MSLVSANTSKGEKSKKFQSLNINNIYQGASSKPQQKTAPTKHGLQSLGKVPTARRAPANLPSLKAENFGNDPNISLVPASGGGWGSQQQQTSGQQQPQLADNHHNQQQPQQQNNTVDSLNNSTGVTSSDPNSGKSWVNSGTSSGSNKSNFLSQRSPLFGQEFPSLETAAEQEKQKGIQQQQQNQQNSSQQSTPSQQQTENGSGKPGDKYGPGPSLRPQSYGHWAFGGKPQQQATNSQQQSSNEVPANEINRSVPPPNIGLHPPPPIPRSVGSVANTLKFDVSANTPLQYFGGPVVSRKQPHPTSSGNPDQGQGRTKSAPTKGGGSRDGALFQASIIDRDKLRRMDDIDANEDDWTRSDETFDYNKKIDSDDEDDEGKDDLNTHRTVRSSWTDQLIPQKHSNPIQKDSSNRFDYPPPTNNAQSGRKLNQEIPFFDDEDQRRAKKSEEVQQNLERARRRREEEEQKYKSIEYSPPSQPRHSSERHSSGDAYQNNVKRQSEIVGQPRRTYRQQSCSSNSSREENQSAGKHGYGKFEVTPPPQQEYDDRRQYDVRGGDQGGFGSRKQIHSSTGVPPRFKRNGGELQQFKRSFQGKGPHPDDDYRPQQARHWERQASESERANDEATPQQQHQNRVRNDSEVDRSQTQNSKDEIATASTTASATTQPNTFIPLSASNSKDNFETGSSYSSSSVERFIIPASTLAAAPTTAPSKIFEEDNSGKAIPMEQSNHLRRAEQGPRKRDDEMQQQHYNNHRHREEFDYAGKRNGNDGFGRGRGGSRGGRGRGSDNFVRNPKKIILPSSNNKRPSDDEVEETSTSKASVEQQFVDQTNVVVVEEEDKKQKQMTPEVEKTEAQQSLETAMEEQQDGTGWFAPRGQPSRRGRGGLSGVANHRSMAKNDLSQQTGTFNDEDGGRESSSECDDEKRRQRKDDRRGVNVGRGGIRKDDDYSDYRHPRRQNSQPGKVDVMKRGPPLHSQQQLQHPNLGQQSKLLSFERRQNKLPPRLAKQKEQNRMKYAGREGWGGPDGQNSGYQWDNLGPDPSTDLETLSNNSSSFRTGNDVGAINVEGLQIEENSVQTIIFENTNFKSDKMFKNIDGTTPTASSTAQTAALQMSQLGFHPVKTEDSDLKLDFTFEPSDMQPHHADEKPLNRTHPGAASIPAAADDLNLKIASVKKVWENESSMSPGPDGGPNVNQAGFASQGFVVPDEKTFPDVALSSEDPTSTAHVYDKSDLSAANVAKVRPQQQQQQTQHQQQQQHLHHQHLLQQQIESSRSVAYNRLLGSAGGLPTLHSPPSILNQPPSMYQAFQMDPSRAVPNPIYSTYHGLNAQSVLSAADLFGPPPTNNQFRMPTTNAAGQFSGGQSTASQVLLSQSLMSSGGMKPANQIGPIGTKAGNAYQQGGLGGLATSGTSPLLIPYDGGVNPMNYMPGAMQRSAPGQTAFYQALATNQAVNSRQQQTAFNMQGYSQQQLQQQQQLLNAQLRNQFMKQQPDPSAMKNVGNQFGALHQQAAAAAAVAAATKANMTLRSHMGPSHGGGMPQQAVAPGPTYSPTPIQRPQGKVGNDGDDCQEANNVGEKKMVEE